MTFLYEQLLYLLIIPLVFFILSFKGDKKDLNNFFSQNIISKLRTSPDKFADKYTYRLLILVSILLIVSISRPVIKENKSIEKKIQTSLIIALDVSKSMKQTDIYPSRLEFAKQKLNYLVQLNGSINIGVILFTQNAYSLFPISDDMKVLKYMIKHTDFTTNLGEGSNIFAALEAGYSMLSHTDNKNILLLSDGGNSPNMDQELSYLKQQHIQLYTINIAPKTHQGLQTLSQESGGKYSDFSWGTKDIEGLIAQMKKNSIQEQKKYTIHSYTQLFIYPLGLAVAILFFLLNPNLRFAKNLQVLSLILLTGLSPLNTPAKAGLLDFYYLNKANHLYKDKRYKEAIYHYKKLLSTDNSIKFKIFHNIANAYVQLDKLDSAKKYYKKSLKINPNSLSKENLKELIRKLAQRKKLKKKKKPKNPFQMASMATSLADLDYEQDSSYKVKMEHLILSEENSWLKRLENINTPSFLQKMKTEKRSKNASKAW